MTNPKTLIVLLLAAILLTGLPASAGNRNSHKTVPSQKPPQVPFSFIAPHQPNPTLARLQTTLQGRVVTERQTHPAQPRYTQIFPTAPAPTLIQPAISSNSPTTIPTLTETPSQPASIPKAVRTIQSRWHRRPIAPDYKERSWVSDLTAPQALPLATNIAAFLAKQFDPETTTLLLAQPNKKQLNNPLTPELEAQLRHAGFTLVTTRTHAPQAQLVQYQINVLGNGILVQLHTPYQWTSRYYPLTATQALMATHPFSIRILGDITP